MQIKVNHRTSDKAGLEEVRVLSGIVKSGSANKSNSHMMNRTAEAFLLKSVLTKKETLEAKYSAEDLDVSK